MSEHPDDQVPTEPNEVVSSDAARDPDDPATTGPSDDAIPSADGDDVEDVAHGRTERDGPGPSDGATPGSNRTA
ncbi:hypothetical protein [Nocardioides zeae]|uniref:Uncharacterized protein n=1 Tax=Nocardioides zeae TaxID=1457234 RepID=A0AAJ1TXS0_9ACTN|nr:hypothetical protein [Nocardioides zeae]MDQ1104281.1 hypothetical protein [Nocardioides zeae]